MEENPATGPIRTWRALERVIASYFRSRRGRVDEFARARFSMRSVLRSQADTLGGDLVRHPLNALWSIPCLAIRNASLWFEKLGLDGARRFVDRLPTGIRTSSQKRAEAAIVDELLGLPSHALLAEAAADPELRELCASAEGFSLLSFQDVDMRKALSDYGASRMGIYDLGGSLGALVAGYVFFGDGFMSPVEMSHHVARRLSHRHVVSHFFFETGLGSMIFDIFPADPRVTRLLIASLIVFLGLATISLLAGMIADPILIAVGAHQRKILRLLDRLEQDLQLQTMRLILSRVDRSESREEAAAGLPQGAEQAGAQAGQPWQTPRVSP